MKALYIISAGIVFFLTTSMNSVEAQNRSRREYHKEERSDRHNEREHKDHHKKYEKHHRQHRGNKHTKHRHYVNRDRQNSCQHTCNSSHNTHVHHRNTNHHTNYRYATYYTQRLPSHQYLSFKLGNDIYYHCNGMFYSYIPSRGYTIVQLKLISVRHLPNHFSFREVNGRRYYYSDEYYYIPHEYGYYRVSTSRQNYTACRVNY